jgi:hypothetical protein
MCITSNPSELLIMGLNPKLGKAAAKRESGTNPKLVTYAQAESKQQKAIDFLDRIDADDPNDIAGMSVEEYAEHKGFEIASGTNPEKGKRKKVTKGRAKKTRKNVSGDSLTEAERAYTEFHGKEPETVRDLVIKNEIQRTYTYLGEFSRAKFLRDDGKVWEISFDGDGVKLAGAPDGKQLYLIGGNQDILPILKDQGLDTSKDLISFGRWFCVYYVAAKSQTNFEVTEWEHYLGCRAQIDQLLQESKEKGWSNSEFQKRVQAAMDVTPPLERDLPEAIYDARNKRCLFAGGSYYVSWPGIVG